jgi:hypothetical protein
MRLEHRAVGALFVDWPDPPVGTPRRHLCRQVPRAPQEAIGPLAGCAGLAADVDGRNGR